MYFQCTFAETWTGGLCIVHIYYSRWKNAGEITQCSYVLPPDKITLNIFTVSFFLFFSSFSTRKSLFFFLFRSHILCCLLYNERQIFGITIWSKLFSSNTRVYHFMTARERMSMYRKLESKHTFVDRRFRIKNIFFVLRNLTFSVLFNPLCFLS